jgi:replicative DNA helicase
MELTESLQREKLPPQNVEAEMAVLGSMLIDEEAIASGLEKLTPAAFYDPANRLIFRKITDLFEQSKAVDLVTLTEELQSENALTEAGGASYLTQLTGSVPTAANIDYYIRIVKEKYILRSLIQSATQIVRDGYETSQDAEELLDRAEKMIFEIATQKFQGGMEPIKEIVKNCIETIDQLYQRKVNITGIPTGFHEFDIQTAGLQRSDLIVVAARPSMGKSAFVTNIAEFVAITEKIPTAIFSLEMSKEQLTQRMLCSQARVNAHKVRTGFLAQSDWPKLTAAAARLSEAPIFIDDTPGVSALEIRAKARRLKAQQDIQLLIVDYLQLMRADSAAENRQQEVSVISRSLKALARELNIPVIAVSQLSRAVESRTDHRPQLSDLRESGAIEQDSDMVVLLLREEYYGVTDENRGVAEINIAKQRNGPIGSLKLTFIKEYTRFENPELARRTEAAGAPA